MKTYNGKKNRKHDKPIAALTYQSFHDGYFVIFLLFLSNRQL
ncbi:hypothetical protein HBHAL_1872 [Halobacillus halophilus DSM 2266]|uniref:Uncharacterized protein n=1 Tax=Halobacillus halophilus (strain ATCC 35676 / DSM 2266 / JCM 20832 / KCTC 3685 / LMG 17431 / NBRC 102448 / NCIMB 2269) TaxID=866895 RepID=I0JJB6_HALH3|nr:hypothetical protein HBHAL_1872 [Halobacillus halophilus DSM 2266]